MDEARCYKETLSIVIRYAWMKRDVTKKKNVDIYEICNWVWCWRVIGFTDCCTSRDAKTVAAIILNLHKKWCVENASIVAVR